MSKKCVDCGGSGFVICIEWNSDGYNDYPGTYGTADKIGPLYDMRKHWTESCALCAGTGWIHYAADGRLVPGA